MAELYGEQTHIALYTLLLYFSFLETYQKIFFSSRGAEKKILFMWMLKINIFKWMPNIRLTTLRAWSCLLKCRWMENSLRSFSMFYSAFSQLSDSWICSFGKKDVVWPLGFTEPGSARGVLLPHWRQDLPPPSYSPIPLCWAEHGRATTSQTEVTMPPASQHEPTNPGPDCKH